MGGSNQHHCRVCGVIVCDATMPCDPTFSSSGKFHPCGRKDDHDGKWRCLDHYYNMDAFKELTFEIPDYRIRRKSHFDKHFPGSWSLHDGRAFIAAFEQIKQKRDHKGLNAHELF